MSARPAPLSLQLELPAEAPAAHLPVLARLLGRTTAGPLLTGSASDWLLHRLTGSTTCDWGAWCGQAHAPIPADTATCLRLEGVVLAASMNSISMQRAPASVEAADQHALQPLLADTFAAYGAQLVEWQGLLLACFRTALQLRTHSLAQCAGQALRDCLPQGRDADAICRLLTECQMVLHAAADPLRARAGSSVQAVNGIWLSGLGHTDSADHAGLVVPAGQAPITGLAGVGAPLYVHTGVPWLHALAASVGTAGSDDPVASACAGVPTVWHGALDASALPGLLQAADRALLRGQLVELQIGLWRDSLGRGQQQALGPWQRRQFWRAPRSPWLELPES